MSVSLGKRIKTLRALNGLYQRHIADLLGINLSMMPSIESDSITLIPQQIERLNDYFGFDIMSSEISKAFEKLIKK